VVGEDEGGETRGPEEATGEERKALLSAKNGTGGRAITGVTNWASLEEMRANCF